ncbi:ESF1 homolog [Lepisosteus oculatus]|uniref:ESF1 homolog n=1 Tax=Lepisosteus oculatus TaxID=7918 RepID=UPI0035F521E5
MASKNSERSDERFSRMKQDPRFWEMPETEQKIKIDKRFQSMFHDKRFKLKYTVDKRGRPINHSSAEDLKRFYKVSDSEESDHEEKKAAQKMKKKKQKLRAKVDVEGDLEEETEQEKPKNEAKKKDSMQLVGNVSEKASRKGTGKKNTSHLRDLPDSGDGSEGTVQKCQALRVSVGEKHLQKGKGEESSAPEQPTKKSKARVTVSDPEKSVNEEKTKFDTDDEDDDSGADMSEVEQDEEEGSSEEEEEDDSDEGKSAEDSEDESEEESDSGPDLARGKGNIETSSDEDEEDDLTDLFRPEEELEHDWGELWKDAPRGDNVTRRLAVCNMDWDRLKAKDLLALFNSFKPKGGVVLSVKIYPSEFGKERMKAEQLQGPLELVILPENPDKDTEEERLYREKMREYQFKRMRYFYAVVECDSPETAAKIYEECDGFEYESSCSVVDLRFIPDDITFDEQPKDVASDVDLASYTPKYFSSTAVATSKVELTWDETDHERVTMLNRKFKKDEIMDMDFQAYLASSSEEESDHEAEDADDEEKRAKKAPKDDAEQIAKYRDLLKSIQDKDGKHQEKDMEMEISWVPGLKETAEQLVKRKLEGKDKLTPWEEYLEKKKEKKKQKKMEGTKAAVGSDLSDDDLPPDVDLDDPYFAEELGKGGTALKNKSKAKKNKKSREEERTPEEEAELEKQRAEMALLMDDDEDENRKHFNYDKIVEQQNLSKKKKKKLLKKNELLEEDNFEVDVQDPRFQAMYTSHLFNLDPSEPAFRKTKATQSIVEEKRRRREEAAQRKERELEQESPSKLKAGSKTTMDAGLSMLVRSIKSKTEQFQARKKQKTK